MDQFVFVALLLMGWAVFVLCVPPVFDLIEEFLMRRFK